MPKMRTKQGENVYRTARNAGVLFTHELKNQEGAAELLEIERTRLARIELGQIQPRPEEVLRMADMIYYKTQLKQLFPDDLPDIYYQPLPPDFPTGYMVVGTKYFDKRMKNMNGWSLVFSKPDEGLALF